MGCNCGKRNKTTVTSANVPAPEPYAQTEPAPLTQASETVTARRAAARERRTASV